MHLIDPTKTMSKCSPKDFCAALNRRVQDRHLKGIVEWHLINLKTGRTTARLVGYKEKGADKGLLLNFCPWCGHQFNWDTLKLEEAHG